MQRPGSTGNIVPIWLCMVVFITSHWMGCRRWWCSIISAKCDSVHVLIAALIISITYAPDGIYDVIESHIYRPLVKPHCTMCIVEYTVILPKQNQLTYTHMRRRINATWPSARDFWAHIRDSLTHIHASHANRRNSGIAGKIDIMYTA